MITLNVKWNSGHCIFPAGTVFIPQRTVRGRQIYSYGTPDGGHGEVILDDDNPPGSRQGIERSMISRG